MSSVYMEAQVYNHATKEKAAKARVSLYLSLTHTYKIV